MSKCDTCLNEIEEDHEEVVTRLQIQVNACEERALKAERERDALESQLQAAAEFAALHLPCKKCPINCSDRVNYSLGDCIDKLREHWRQQAGIYETKSADNVQCKNCGGKGTVQIVRNGIPCRGIETCPVCNGGKGVRA